MSFTEETVKLFVENLKTLTELCNFIFLDVLDISTGRLSLRNVLEKKLRRKKGNYLFEGDHKNTESLLQRFASGSNVSLCFVFSWMHKEHVLLAALIKNQGFAKSFA